MTWRFFLHYFKWPKSIRKSTKSIKKKRVFFTPVMSCLFSHFIFRGDKTKFEWSIEKVPIYALLGVIAPITYSAANFICKLGSKWSLWRLYCPKSVVWKQICILSEQYTLITCRGRHAIYGLHLSLSNDILKVLY